MMKAIVFLLAGVCAAFAAQAQPRQPQQSSAIDRDRSPFSRPEAPGAAVGQGGYPAGAAAGNPYGGGRPGAVPGIQPGPVGEVEPSMLPNPELRQLGNELQTTMELLAVQLDPPTSARVRLTRGNQGQSRTVLQGEVLNLGNVQYTVHIAGDSLANARLLLLVVDPKDRKKKGAKATLVAHEIWLGSAPSALVGPEQQGRAAGQPFR